MKYIKSILKLFIIHLICLMLFSCGASHDIIERPIFKDKGFSYAELKNNSVIVGGVTSQQLFLEESDRIRYGNLLAASLVENLVDVHTINLLNTRQFVERIGYENYVNIMKESDVERQLHQNAIEFIREDFPDYNYIIMINIENENIIDRSDSDFIYDEEGEEKLETEYEKIYFLTVEFQIYNLVSEEMVYRTQFYNRANRSETRTTETGCVESVFTGIINDVFWGSPAEIDREEVLAEIYNNFSSNLSKQ